MDEMQKNIKLRSQSYAFKAVLLMLIVWVIYESYGAFVYDKKINILPSLLLEFTITVQYFSELIMKRKMILGDEEYKEPNKVLWNILFIVVTGIVIIMIGNYILISTLFRIY